ncbi:sensor histidine kinase [Streptomyces sp. 4N509B]|uniref:sensor histidine kinase n=1 Tax=Streptomyces sp. 4N509B TaxID=3457413 RepID=UPI003FD46CC7
MNLTADLARVRPWSGGRLTDAQLVALDCLLALAYATLLLVVRHTDPEAGGPRGEVPGAVADLLILAGGLPLAVRRVWPRPVFAVVLAAAVVGVLLWTVREPFLAVAFAAYPVALARPTGPWLPATGAGLLAAAGLVGPQPDVLPEAWWARGPGVIVIGWALLAGSWALGTAVRERQAYAARAAERLAERAVADERLRIARELHDAVAHSIGVIAVKAAIANHVVATRPQEASEALRVIEDTSRGALREMRHVLGLLRSGDLPGGEETAPRGPTTGRDGLLALARDATASGLRVSMDVRGAEGLPESVGLTVYRVVQEALTNAARHAAPTDCRVTVRRTGREVEIEVTDDGRDHGRDRDRDRDRDRGREGRLRAEAPPREPGCGLGLVGMRERIAVFGGEFAAGPRPGGGFGVLARIPHEAPASPVVPRATPPEPPAMPDPPGGHATARTGAAPVSDTREPRP